MRYSICFFILLMLCLPGYTASGQAGVTNRFEMSAVVGTRGTSTEQPNFFNESVRHFDRSLGLVLAEVTFSKGDDLMLWARYADGLNQERYVLGGLDRKQMGIYLGGRHNAGPYTMKLEYAYHAYQDSLYQDALMIEQAFELAGGLRPTLNTWVGIGTQALIEWMIQAGVVIPVSGHVGIEPVVIGTRTLLNPDASMRIGMRAHLGLPDKGRITAALSREIGAIEEPGVVDDAQTSLYVTGIIPFSRWHQLHMTVQHNTRYPGRTTLFAIGMTIGIGRAG